MLAQGNGVDSVRLASRGKALWLSEQVTDLSAPTGSLKTGFSVKLIAPGALAAGELTDNETFQA
jgi:hypothetical protein